MNDTEKRKPTSGELTDLFTVVDHLKEVVDLYNKTAEDMGGLADIDAAAFSKLEPGTTAAHDGSSTAGDVGTAPGGAYEAWVEARDEFQYLMAAVAANLATAANGFIEAYNDFKGTDEDNAYDLEKDINWPDGHD
ncbi:MAG: hypothetical protein ACRD0P_08870, partial [Stackebrandtia sp.]